MTSEGRSSDVTGQPLTMQNVRQGMRVSTPLGVGTVNYWRLQQPECRELAGVSVNLWSGRQSVFPVAEVRSLE